MGKLADEIVEIIYEEVPLNLICPCCDTEIEAICIINLGEGDAQAWHELAVKVIKKVINRVIPPLDNIEEL